MSKVAQMKKVQKAINQIQKRFNALNKDLEALLVEANKAPRKLSKKVAKVPGKRGPNKGTKRKVAKATITVPKKRGPKAGKKTKTVKAVVTSKKPRYITEQKGELANDLFPRASKKPRYTTEQKDALVIQVRSLGRGGLTKISQQSGVSMMSLIKWNKESNVKVSPKETVKVISIETKTGRKGRTNGSKNKPKFTTPIEPSVAELSASTIFENAAPIEDIAVGFDDPTYVAGRPSVP